ncbi:MAG: glycine--tRNA ligase subunit beta [Coxiella sp. RIFCSPHIGHO2_12_FULL_44_14]|nr:MAG: glycine--tRNA ligase subunit beta [Coxiella sp. RIFCSPHIGHO2_12_FULL_44_14]
MHSQDLLFEIGCCELPAKSLLPLSHALSDNLTQQLNQAELTFASIKTWVTPRRLTLLVSALNSEQPSQIVERQGPSIDAAFDKNGTPTLACIGFARSCGVTADELRVKDTDKGKRVVCQIKKTGAKTRDLLPELILTAFNKLSLSKPMRWGNNDKAFVRPVQWLVALYGNEIVPIELLGVHATNKTYGHRFHHPHVITLTSAQEYEKMLKNPGMVIVDYHKRQQMIREQIHHCAAPFGKVIVDEKLLEEVTALVEWPVALVGQFKQEFLDIPDEVLITSMKVHQKCFSIMKPNGTLSEHFIVISNIESKDPRTVIKGNERVLNARLADASFFYDNDLNHPLSYFIERLSAVIFQKQLGTLFDRTQRLMRLCAYLAKQLQLDITLITRAAELSKFDLITEMVGEFPELQGVMGFYYALQAKENKNVAIAIKEHYYPRFSGDRLPQNTFSAVLALADRLDLLVGILGVNLIPSSDKDPYALRRAAVGIIRIIVELQLPLDLIDLLQFAQKNYADLPNKEVIPQAFEFMNERMRSWYLEKGISAEIFAAVAACTPTKPYDFDQRLKAVQQFQSLPESTSLAAANKRVSNILKKSLEKQKKITINSTLFENDIERKLADLVEQKSQEVNKLYQSANYTEALAALATLKEPVDRFFDHVMIMVEDKKIRDNRIALLNELHHLFTQVADISLL